MSTIVNGAPMTVLNGIQDKSTRVLPIEPEVLPTHLPKVYIFAQKGPTKPQLVVGNGRDRMYGSDSFDLRSKFANHQTVLSNLVNAEGNAQMIERLVPADAGPKSNFLLSLDLLPADIPQYARDSAGLIQLDSITGLPVPVAPAATTPGFIAKWVVTSVTSKGPNDADSDLFGVASSGSGDQTLGGQQSTRYPILEFWANSEGSFFNNTGLRFWAPNENSTGGVNTTVMSSRGVYPFRMSAISRASSSSTAKITATLAGEPFFDFCLKPGVINPATDAQFYLGDVYLGKFESKDVRFPPQFGDLNGFKIYQENIDTVLGLLYNAEANFFGTTGSDFTVGQSADVGKYLYNLFTFASSSNAPYYSIKLNTADANAVRLSEGTNIFAKGGSDGTLTSESFNQMVASSVAEYANPNSELMNSAVYVESIIYDTGFDLDTKKALCNFISIRKDTAVVLGTYEVDGQSMSASEDHSVAVALRTKLQMFPESDYFGTPVVRGIIIGRNGVLRNSQFTKRLPLTLELAVKSAKMMGAGNGRWKQEYVFDKAPTNQINMFDDVSVTYTPAQQRNKDWDVGLNYAMNFSRSALYFPALKTAYNDDTSVLNSYFTMMACVELNKVGERVHRMFTGSTTLTDAQLIERVNQAVENMTVGRFADLFKIVPAAYMSDADVARGYSWTLPIRIYANNMKTVMTLSIESYRMSDYVAA
jgi:hypothetical protein